MAIEFHLLVREPIDCVKDSWYLKTINILPLRTWPVHAAAQISFDDGTSVDPAVLTLPLDRSMSLLGWISTMKVSIRSPYNAVRRGHDEFSFARGLAFFW